MSITSICTLLTTRFGLQALGAVDFGLFALLGGIIAAITILNNIMVSTSNRFLAVSIGKGNIDEANKQFNVNLSIHVAIAVLVLIIAYPIGDWYIHRYVNYDGPISNAMMVYCITVLGSVISFISVPYNGLLMAKENFIVFSGVDVFTHIVKLIIAWILLYHFTQKLFVYTLAFAILQAVPTLWFIFYCKCHYSDIVKLRKVNDRTMYKKVFAFSSWIGVGALAHAVKVHGAAIVINVFFNTLMNTAMGVASSINSYVTLFALNVTQPMAPQITKSYASGNKERTNELLIMSTKYSYMLTLLVGAIFLASPKWIMELWLVEVPPYATTFLVLLIIDNVVLSLNSGIQNIIFASGNIKLYQLCTSFLNILSVILGYVILRVGAPAYYLIVSYIMVSIVRFFILQWTLRHTLKYDNRILWRGSYQPSLLIALFYVPVLFIPDMSHPLIKLFLTFSYLCVIMYFIGLSREERKKLERFIHGIFFRK